MWVCSFKKYSGLMKWGVLNKIALKGLRSGNFRIVVFLICPLPYIFLFIIQIVLPCSTVHKYNKKFESTNMDLIHS